MSRGFRAVSSRLEGKVYETRFTEAHGIHGPEGLVGIAAFSTTVGCRRFCANSLDRQETKSRLNWKCMIPAKS